MVGQASAAQLYTAHKLVDGTAYTQKTQDSMYYLNPSGGGGGGTVAWSSYHDTIRTWDLSQGFVSATAMTDLGNPYSPRWGMLRGLNDAGNVSVIHADGNYTPAKHYHDGVWNDGDQNGNQKMGRRSVGSTEAHGTASGDWWVYDYTTGTGSYMTGAGSYMDPGAMNNNNDKLAFKVSSGYRVALWTNASGVWTDVATSINRPEDLNDNQVIVGFDEISKIGYAYDVPNATEYAIPFMDYDAYMTGTLYTATRCYPTAINNNGLVVGYQDRGDDGLAHGFVWDMNNPTAAPLDLGGSSQAVTDLTDVLGLPGYGNSVIHHVNDINDDNTIVARSQAGGYLIVLTYIPEPATLMVLLAGASLALLRRRA